MSGPATLRTIGAVLVIASLVIPSAPRSVRAADHVLLVGVDGLGSEGLRSARAPAIHALIDGGASTLAARGVLPTVSSPNWASMISGAGPEQHGVTSNDWEPNRHPIDPVATDGAGIFPTIFGAVRRQMPQAPVGIVHEWDGFARLVEPGVATILRHEVDADKTVETAAAFIRERKPLLTVVHLDLVDHAGHASGWLTPAYAQAVERADALVATLLAAIDGAGMRSRTIVMISADHGGVGKSHGGLTKAEIEIPWIIGGPGVKRGHVIDIPVSTLDTAPTILFALGMHAPAVWVGRPVLDAFAGH
ncbi:MAG TPA: alkaline phosphatase [Vicinamibacterales bacterium]|nr:alkaline phosphatase [Vicinamibacterales bacterium]